MTLPRNALLSAGAVLTVAALLAAGVGVPLRAEQAAAEKPAAPAARAPGAAEIPADPFENMPEQMKESFREAEAMRRRLEQALEMRRRIALGAVPFGVGPGRAAVRGPEPRLGAVLEKPDAALADQLELPRDQGMVVRELTATSPAAKAGLKPHDILLELSGKPVPSDPAEFGKLLDGVKPDTPTDLMVMRKGKREGMKGLSLPAAPARVVREAGEAPEFPALPDVFGGMAGGRAFPFGLAGPGGMTMTSRTNGQFTTVNQSGGARVTVKGKLEAGKARVTEVEIQGNGQTNSYESLDKVPEEYKARVKALVEMNEAGAGRARPWR